MGFGSGSGGSSSIAGASDTLLSNPVTNEVLTYDGTIAVWKNAENNTDAIVSNNNTIQSIEYYPNEAALPVTGTPGVLYVIPVEGS